jgi:hypothetical protein
LTPGVVPTNLPTHGWLPHAVDSVLEVTSVGTRTRSSEFTLDGIPNMLRVEAQDALNHAMFAAPNTAPTTTLFGQVNSIVATEQRRVTLGGKLSW